MLVGIIFDGKVDRCVFKSVTYGWYPKKNCRSGKALYARLKSVKTKNTEDALELVGLSPVPSVFSENRCYSSASVVISEDNPIVYVSVPWYDEDPKKIEQYKKDNAAGIHSDRSLDSILWEPTPEMKEVKAWEFEKHVSEWNEKQKPKNKA